MTIAAATFVFVVAMAWVARAGLVARQQRRVRRRLAVRAGAPAVPVEVRRWWDRAALPWPVESAWRWWLRMVCAALALAAVVPALGLVSITLAVGAPALVLGLRRHRLDDRLVVLMPELLESVASSCRSGATVLDGLREAARPATAMAAEVAPVLHGVGAGLPLVEALDQWSRAHRLPAVRLAGTSLATAAGAGGPAAQVLDRVAAGMRAEVAVAAEAAALASQARLSGWVIALAPLAFAALGGAADGRTAAFLLRSPAGALCLAGGLALDGLGAAWMQRITADPW
jgi:tight adherence protein B